jgi:hypothetical protein
VSGKRDDSPERSAPLLGDLLRSGMLDDVTRHELESALACHLGEYANAFLAGVRHVLNHPEDFSLKKQ